VEAFTAEVFTIGAFSPAGAFGVTGSDTVIPLGTQIQPPQPKYLTLSLFRRLRPLSWR